MAQGMILENLHISPQFFRDVISGHTRADTSVLGFRDPDTLIAGNIHACFPAWEGIANIAPFKLTPEEFTLNPGPFHVTVLGSLFLTLLLTVCCLGLSPYGVSLFGMISLAMTISSSLWKAALIFGFEWGGWYFASSTIPFGWKASAYIYHSIGLLASHYFRSLHEPSSLYIDDRHTGKIQLSPLVPVYASISSALAKSLACANSAIFIICFTVITLRYFLGIKKSILVPRQIVPFLGFLGKCISFPLAIPGTRLFLNEVYNAIGIGLRYGSSNLIPISGPLREELQQWLFLKSWSDYLPWCQDAHCQVKLCLDASSFAWGCFLGPDTIAAVIRDFWPCRSAPSPYQCQGGLSPCKCLRCLFVVFS
ncbi:hypothetical protein P5673_030260 [Acropora cervicornis]|uniref:Uncharacterized protein n=1 Tax=Acropora cervicornis TaxID=6130 RepID=A0AAD9PUT5_ACRCE|nr:hypothetical protein P5673_030260 [Acropora cervicornis]